MCFTPHAALDRYLPYMTPNGQPTGRGGHYDLRQGAAAYAPIVGTFGALAVPAIILLFTVPRPATAYNVSLITLTAGLLIVSTIASLIGAVSFAAIGAETELTGNIPAAVMFIAVSVVISFVNVMAAFEVLIEIYFPQSGGLFKVIVAVGGIIGVNLLSFAIGDSWHTGPVNPTERTFWLCSQWIQSKQQAQKTADIGGLVGAVPIAMAAIFRLFIFSVSPTPVSIDCLVGSGLGLAVLGTLQGNRRTSHPADGIETGLRPWEALTSILSLTAYVVVLLIFLP